MAKVQREDGSRSTVANAEPLPPVRVNRQIRLDIGVVDAFMKANSEET